MADEKGKYAYNYLVSKGLSPTAAAGIIGNLHAESGLNTRIPGRADNKGSIGIAQWHSERKQGLYDFAKRKGANAYDLTTQLDYLVDELKSPAYKKAFVGVSNARTPDEAAVAFMKDFEKPAEWAKRQSIGQRVGMARSIFSGTPYQNVNYQEEGEYGVDTSLNLPMNTGEYQTAPDIASKEDLEAEQAKAELLQKQKEKDFISEVQARQDQDSERRYQQEQQIQQGQEGDLDPSYYQVPQVELPNYQAIQYQQAQGQAQMPQEQQQYKDGGEIKGRVKCSSCGWEWDKSDSSKEDMYNCHKCGGENKGKDVMKNGGQMMTKYEDGGENSQFDNESARDWWVKKTGKTWAEAKKLGYSDGTASSNIELLNRLKDKNFTIANSNNKPSQRSDMKQFNGFSQEDQNSMQNTQPPVTRKTIKAPIAKAKKEIKEVDQISLFEKVMRGDFSPQGNERKLQNGVITDKRTNTNYILENGKVIKSFPVLTGANPDMNINDKGVAYLETHPESKATPRGTYIMNPKDDIYGQPGFRLNPVAAFGEPAARAKDIAQHVTYDFAKRNPLYTQDAKNRYTSYGCINCRKPDINYMTDRFKKGDTTMVIDSKIKRDADFLSKKLFTRK